MERYDRTRGCPKCGCWDGTVEYTQIYKGGDKAEAILRRHCGRCGCYWDEKPLDTEEESK